ncbi:MAG: alpha/beta fold hydrolase [Lachnospiraceae bacterium]|nr:alpha/beta fold hydrolase [Lachnospiraceae bacterium]
MIEHFGIMKADTNIVPCVSEIPDGTQKIVIAVHGFTSSKESVTVQMLLKRLPAAGIGVIGIDLPAHGKAQALEEELTVDGAIDSIAAVEGFIEERWPDAEICYFGSSFGAYLIGLYISTRPHRGRKAFFRSAAVNMPSLFVKEDPTEQELLLLKEVEEKGYVMIGLGGDSMVRITKALIDGLSANDLFEKFDPERFGHHKIAMAHGSIDSLIDPAAAKSFADRFKIPNTIFEGKGHSLGDGPDDDTPLKVADLAIRLFTEQ